MKHSCLHLSWLFTFQSCAVHMHHFTRCLVTSYPQKLFCKVEFNQPSYWFYSVPNLLVFLHLVTLYLGGFVVRVVSEMECWLLKSVQENRDSWLDLAAVSRQMQHTCQACQKVNSHASWSTTGQNRTIAHTVISRLGLATWLGQVASHPCFVKPDVSHSSLTPV